MEAMWRRRTRGPPPTEADDPIARTNRYFAEAEREGRAEERRERRAVLLTWTWPPLVTAVTGVGLGWFMLGAAYRDFGLLLWMTLTYGVACACAGVVVLREAQALWASGEPPPPGFVGSYAVAIPALGWTYLLLALILVVAIAAVLFQLGIVPP